MDQFDLDISLMLRARDGDEKAFEELVERHKQRVFSFAYRFLGDYQAAEDVAQEIFISVYHARKNYFPQAKFTTWLYVICRNACLKAVRRKRPSQVSIDQAIDLEEGTVSVQIEDPKASSPSETVLKEEKALVVKGAINALPENQRTVVLFHRYEQLSYEEIAQVTGFSVKAVKSLLHRARVNLKDKLTDYFNK
mgnify:CR=1 FL=1